MNFYINQAMGMGNSGVEHAQFYRAKRFDQAGLPYRFVFLNLVPDLHKAMDRWNLLDNQVLNLWEYLVLGNEYLERGLTKRFDKLENTLIVDDTNTNRKREQVTDAGIRIVQHYLKAPDKQHPKNKILQVGVSRVELFNAGSNERRVMYEVENDAHRGVNIVNIHLFNEKGNHLFFRNLHDLHRYFFEQLDLAYKGHSTFIIDRGEFADDVLMASRIPNSKIIYIVHADQLADRNDKKYPLWNDHYEYMLEHMDAVDKVVTATKLQREDMLVDSPESTDKIVAIPVGGVRDRTQHNSNRMRKHKPLRFITASRLASEKHIDIAIKALAKLHDEGVNLIFDIYGQGGEQKKLEETIAQANAENYIRLKGFSDDLENVYPKYDVFISTSFSEGFGLTYIEALNAGLPVITFNARFGARELIKDAKNGFLVPFKRTDDNYNVEQIMMAVKKLLDSDFYALRKGTRKSVDEFQDHIIAEKWRQLLNEL